jgi:hypothetical protein
MLNVWLRLILAIAAVYRVAQYIYLDDGPFDLLFKLRDRLGAYELGEDGLANTGAGRFLQCFHCIAKYLAVPAGLAVMFPATWSDVILVVLGIAGLASIIGMRFRRAR